MLNSEVSIVISFYLVLVTRQYNYCEVINTLSENKLKVSGFSQPTVAVKM